MGKIAVKFSAMSTSCKRNFIICWIILPLRCIIVQDLYLGLTISNLIRMPTRDPGSLGDQVMNELRQQYVDFHDRICVYAAIHVLSSKDLVHSCPKLRHKECLFTVLLRKMEISISLWCNSDHNWCIVVPIYMTKNAYLMYDSAKRIFLYLCDAVHTTIQVI